jgi:hypothetical protein
VAKQKGGARLELTAAVRTALTTARIGRTAGSSVGRRSTTYPIIWILGREALCDSGEQTGQRSNVGFNIGRVYNFDERNRFLFSAGKGLLNAAETNRVSTSVAYSFTY